MRITIIVFAIFCSTLVFSAQDNLQSAKVNSLLQTKVNLKQSDTLVFKQASDSKESILIDKRIPWIVALSIGLFSALINLFIANSLRRSNERNLQKQIDNAKESAQSEFKATIATKNRQDWINELRHCLSEFLTYSGLIAPNIKFLNIKEKSLLLEKTIIAKSKIELLVNENKPEQNELLVAINNLYCICYRDEDKYSNDDFRDARNNVIKVSRALFAIHWKKIKELK